MTIITAPADTATVATGDGTIGCILIIILVCC